jgi:CDP-4-dehydro-6-deoxyglucose reductase, E1
MNDKAKISIPLNKNTIGKIEIDRVIEVLNSGYLTLGKKCIEFEEKFASYLGVKNAIFVNSGSSANLLAFFALTNPSMDFHKKYKPLAGKEIIVPALTWPTTIWPIIQAGAIPVFVDSSPETLQLDVNQVKKAINSNTAGICVVHILGNAVEMAEIRELSDKHNLWLIEDTCESLGVKHHGQYVGTFGDVSTFSFFFSHHITTIEGGMVVTDNDDLADLIRCLRAHGWIRHMKNQKKYINKYPDIDPRFLFVNTGFNLRPSEINAVIGLEQLKKLSDYNNTRFKIGHRWRNDLAEFSKYFKTIETTKGTEEALFGFPIICKDKKLRDELQNYLEENRIETRPIICGNMARQPALDHVSYKIADTLFGADKVMDCGLYWGSNPLMTEGEISYLTQTIKSFFA